MSYTNIIISLIYPIMLFIGMILLMNITGVGYTDNVDFFACIISMLLLMVFAGYGAALHYGVETL